MKLKFFIFILFFSLVYSEEKLYIIYEENIDGCYEQNLSFSYDSLKCEKNDYTIDKELNKIVNG